MFGATTDTAKTFPTEIVADVKEAVGESFQSFCEMSAVYQEDFETPEPQSNLFAIISFIGDVSWALTMVLPRKTAATLVPKFAGFEIPFDSSDMGDVVGEIVNVIAGHVVARHEERGVKVQMSLPTVGRAESIELCKQTNRPSTDLHFDLSPDVLSFKLATIASEGSQA